MSFNPENAMREALRLERAEALLINPDYEFLEDPNFDGLFTVYKQGAPLYAVNSIDRTCTCPDFSKHMKTCKHLLAGDILLYQNAQCETAEAEFALIASAEHPIFGCDPHAEY